jgi:hypothetical protein
MRVARQYECPKCGLSFRAGSNDVFRHGDLRTCPGCHAPILIDVPPPPLDPTPYGRQLAERVADFLGNGGEIPRRHPYFSGVCLAEVGAYFMYGYANESGVAAFDDRSSPIRQFADRTAFVTWLAAESDHSLNRSTDSGLNSPEEIGITRRLLEEAVAHTE